jgi:hypothetical protein
MIDATSAAPESDRELVLGFKPTARVVSRVNARRSCDEYRVVCMPQPGRREELGPWCRSEDRAWEAACLRQGLRLHRGG